MHISELLLKDLETDTASTPGGSTIGETYKDWRTSTGETYNENLDHAYNEMAGVASIGDPTKVFDVASGLRKRISDGAITDDDYRQLICEDAARLAAKSIAVLDLFDEMGVTEFQSEYKKHMTKLLHAYEDRPPF